MEKLMEIARFLDRRLRVCEIPDESNAVNGLQLEACQEVSTVALAVDASERAIDEALQRKADLLVVHHGLFWAGNRPIVGAFARKLGKAFAGGLSVYSAHIPLDVEPELGNDVGLLRALGLVPGGTFGKYRGIDIGVTATCDLTVAELRARVESAIGGVKVAGRGPDRIRRLGAITGGGGSYASEAARQGLDALVTGEGAHYTALDAEEVGIHLLLAGHYRTETFGVKALGKLLEEQFGLTTFFLEQDTGL